MVAKTINNSALFHLCATFLARLVFPENNRTLQYAKHTQICVKSQATGSISSKYISVTNNMAQAL